ncbi:GTP pyrophosphokinase [Paenibacillus solani]|uniref:GTP pyrophosphokinase n=1 Tax=Paenibacillus solani TaxID=1705565 RepID=UPI003D2DECEF
MKTNKTPDILNEFEIKQGLYKDFSNKLASLISEILLSNKINVHSITFREKELKSLSGKLQRNMNKYNKLEDITDLAGLRIITYFSDEVDLIANLIEKEFDFDKENSIDKRKILDPDRFGYLSMHYVIKLRENRISLPEYSRFKNCSAEIQIRTILQHTWAEIEHDLGYKSKLEIPKDIRRNFSRLAGLLEIADSEFMRIRNDLEDYEEQVSKQIESQPTKVSIDKVSLEYFVNNNNKILEISKAIAQTANHELSISSVFLDRYVERLHYLGIEYISEIENLLNEYSNDIIEFSIRWLNSEDNHEYEISYVNLDIALFYLCYYLVAKKRSFNDAVEYFEKFDIGLDEDRARNSNRLIKIYDDIVG